MKHRFTITQPMTVELPVAFEVEFDTETGEAEVLSNGLVTSHPDQVKRRKIREHFDLDQIERIAYAKLLEDGTIERPQPNDRFMLHGEEHVLDLDWEDEEEIAGYTPEELLENIESVADNELNRSFRLMRGRRRKRIARQVGQ